MANLVICCDGTWNTPDERDRGVPVPTNVVRIFNAVAQRDGRGAEQQRYYHPGVGTNGSWFDRIAGGSTGAGLDRNIMSAYRELCDRYQPGDAIYLFGFSRGAYTVRSLAGFIGRCGLLATRGRAESAIWQDIERLFQQGYRRRVESRDQQSWKNLAFHEGGAAVPIRFLGVWDTVGALGIPDDMALLNLLDNLDDHTFHDTMLGTHIQVARHAVALDEMRATFQPTLWSVRAGQDAKQVWFPGVHSDVGGGYRETGLSDGALAWMIGEARRTGLAFDDRMVEQIRPSHLDVLHDSCDGPFLLLPTQPRCAPLLSASDAPLHPSVIARQKSPPIHQCPYREDRTIAHLVPADVKVFAAQPWNATGLWLEAGRRYRFRADGEWMDASIKCGPDGSGDGHFQLGKLAQLGGTALGLAEEAWKKATGNRAADFKFTRRHENMPWFCLVGAIANGGGVDERQHLAPHESFAIGKGCDYTPQKSGYFYAYANDAWNYYGNNRGRVNLAVA
ncbi:DUF2235 domain-containing protein [Ramlibacter sp. XY19]|uniref:DUF2235 domain-containing protein n=1 Tax=Ramlibacter paludis TaxID=2908000 RepID=UPI0023DBB80C|nr:DUF2235 domain-containing protein [Ramlibacter paludis]MCG2593460.1 DUF2235 domain-containing protein [Ramlibacter paludis]